MRSRPELRVVNVKSMLEEKQDDDEEIYTDIKMVMLSIQKKIDDFSF